MYTGSVKVISNLKSLIETLITSYLENMVHTPDGIMHFEYPPHLSFYNGLRQENGSEQNRDRLSGLKLAE